MISPISSDTSCFRVNLELCLSGLSWTTYRTWLGLLSTEHFEWWQHVTLQKQNLHPRLAPSYAKLLLLPVFVIILNVAMLTAKRTEIHRDMFIETIWEWPCDFFVQDSKGLLLCFPTLPLCFVSIQNETTNISGTNRTETYNFAVTQRIFFQRPFYFVCLLFGCQWVDSAWVLDPQGTPPYAVWTSVWSSWAWEGERSSCTARVLEVVAATEVSMFLSCSSAA